mgnify:CR=1 FL=1
MSKKYWEGEYTLDTDWGGDESTNGLPLPGSAVQTVIKDNIKNLNNNKVGYIAESNGWVHFSSNQEAYDSENYIFSMESTQRYSMAIKQDDRNRNVYFSNEENKVFVWYFKTVELASNNTYYEDVTVDYIIQNLTTGSRIPKSEKIYCNPDSTNDGYTRVEINLDTFLEDGNSKIQIDIKGLKTKQQNAISANLSIITLNMTDNTQFAMPINDSFRINADITCTKSQVYYFEYRIDGTGDFIYDNEVQYIGSGKKVNVNYSVDVSQVENGKHIMEYRLFLPIGATQYYTDIQRIEFLKGEKEDFNEPQILIYTSYNESVDITHEDENLIVHGVYQYVPFSLKYSIYNPYSLTSVVEFIEDKDNTIPSTASIDNGEYGSYNVQFLDEGLKRIKITIKDEDDNVLSDNRIIYLLVEKSNLGIKVCNTNLRIDFSSVNKDNSSDQNIWKSIVNVGGARYENTAIITGSEGWTSNGLVVGENCEVSFDYVPFPYQSFNGTSEGVGGNNGYTFEIEFMTQNVTNEDDVVCNMVDERENGSCGLLITGSEFKFTTPNGNSVSTRFKANEMNRAVIVIRPQYNSSDEFKGLVELYMNGVLSNISKYTFDEKFEVLERDADGSFISKCLKFTGTEGAEIVIKYIRAYNGAIESNEVVNNYILFRTETKDMLNLYNKNNVLDTEGNITYESVVKLGNIPMIIFVGRTVEDELASGDGNKTGDEEYIRGKVDANDTNWYKTLENTTNKKHNVDMDVIYYNPLDKSKNFKFVKAYITPQGTSSMYYPKKNYRIYTQKNEDTRCFFSMSDDVLELDQMIKSNFGENEDDRKYEKWRGTDNYKKRKYSFKDNAQAVKCWCLKADFAETSSSHNTGVARLWGETLKNASVEIGKQNINVFKTNAQAMIEQKYQQNVQEMPDVRTTIDGFPIVVFGAKSYSEPFTFLGQYNFNNDKSTESVFGFCDIDDEEKFTNVSKDYDSNTQSTIEHTVDNMLDKYMTCVETLDNGNPLANFSTVESFDDEWDSAFEFRYPEIPEEPSPSDYQDSNHNWLPGGEEEYEEDYAQYLIDYAYWQNTHLKPFKHFTDWVYSTRWCDVNGNILTNELQEVINNGGEIDENGNTLTTIQEIADYRKRKFSTEKWEHLDVWKMAAYYIYVMRFGAVDQVVKNSMLTSEGPFAYNEDGSKIGFWDSTDVASENYGKYYKWYYINYDNDTIMGVKNDGSLAFGPDILRNKKDNSGNYSYAGWDSTLWNNFDTDDDFQKIVRLADNGISKYMTYDKAINMFDVEQVGKWCERMYNKDAEYKYISPYIADWVYTGSDEGVESFVDKLFMLQGSRTAHRRWWLSRRFNLFDGRWNSGEFATKYVEVKCNYESSGKTFGAVAGANAYFGYQINNITFGGDARDGGTSYEYNSGDKIDWKLYKNIQIGDPIAIYGSTDLLELNLTGISQNLVSISFRFGNNQDLSNKLERLNISIPDELLNQQDYYMAYSSYENLQGDYNIELPKEIDEEYWGSLTYTEEIEPTIDSPKFYRIMVGEEYVYFAKNTGGIRNKSCTDISFDVLDKLQVLKMAGYSSVKSINLANNQFINTLDVSYSSINNVGFAVGSRIKDFHASNALNQLAFENCNSIKLSNILIDTVPLKDNGGIKLSRINIINSDGLNHDNDFKSFILNWMNGGVGHVATEGKELYLDGIKWRDISINDIKTIIDFKKTSLSCVLKGEISMGSNNISHADMELIEELCSFDGINLRVRYPYANVLMDDINDIVAGESLEIGCTVFSDDETVGNNGSIEYKIVREVYDDSDPNTLFNSTTGKYYLPCEVSEIRGGTITLTRNGQKSIITTQETIYKSDVKVIVAVLFTFNGITKFDIGTFTIKDPTYAVKASINGVTSINEKGSEHKYTLSLKTDKDEKPIGTVNKRWRITGNEVATYIASSALSEDNLTLTITTDNENTPEKISRVTIIVEVDNLNENYDDLTIEKEILILNENVILTDVSNKIVMDLCYENNLCSASDAMTRQEAALVQDIGTIFQKVNSETWSFDEFKYFTSVTHLNGYAFSGSKITSIEIPNNVISLGEGVFTDCKNLVTVKMSQELTEMPKKTFYNCSSLESFELPDNVHTIREYAFGGTKMKKIIIKNDGAPAKSIFITTESNLTTIANNAFETKDWTHNDSSNVLEEVTLPSRISIGEYTYNFLLSKKLSKINIISEDTNLLLDNNILYADTGRQTIIRALSIVEEDNIIDIFELTEAQRIYKYAFYNCKSFRQIVLGNNLHAFGLGEGAFCQSHISVVDLRNATNLKEIYDYTFYDMPLLENVYFPMDGELSKMGTFVFYNSAKLTTLTLPNTIKRFGSYVKGARNISKFMGNCGIQEFILPELTLDVPTELLYDCQYLKIFKYSPYFDLAKSKYIVTNANSLEEIYLPLFSRTVGNAKYFVFDETNERVISGPYTNEIDANTFINLLMRKEDEMNNEAIGNYVAKEYEIDENIVINNDFYKTGIEEIETFYGCGNLKEFVLHDDDNNVIMCATNDGILDTVEGTDSLKRGATIIRVENDNKSLVKMAYSYTGYTSNNIDDIEKGAFSNSYITEIKLPSNLKKINEGVFINANRLTDIQLPSTIIEVGAYGFYGTSIKNITLPNSVITIGKGAFSQCGYLTGITLSSNITSFESGENVGDGAFENCAQLTNITIPRLVTSIPKRMFFNCSNLSEIELLSNNIISIGEFAFNGCRFLRSIKLCSLNIPDLLHSNNISDIGVYNYHPFGYKQDNLAGIGIYDDNKILHVAYGLSNQYIEDEDWSKPLLGKSFCNFGVQTLTFKTTVRVGGDIINDYDIIYPCSESGNYKPTNGVVKSGEIFDFAIDVDVYHNEVIFIYSDNNYTNLIGKFNVYYGQNEYTIENPEVFSTSFSINENKIIDDEVVNITKSEYNMLLAKIDHLTRLINLLK